jgi:hypothetical protein
LNNNNSLNKGIQMVKYKLHFGNNNKVNQPILISAIEWKIIIALAISSGWNPQGASLNRYDRDYAPKQLRWWSYVKGPSSRVTKKDAIAFKSALICGLYVYRTLIAIQSRGTKSFLSSEECDLFTMRLYPGFGWCQESLSKANVSDDEIINATRRLYDQCPGSIDLEVMHSIRGFKLESTIESVIKTCGEGFWIHVVNEDGENVEVNSSTLSQIAQSHLWRPKEWSHKHLDGLYKRSVKHTLERIILHFCPGEVLNYIAFGDEDLEELLPLMRIALSK